jgi:hypothetical protein
MELPVTGMMAIALMAVVSACASPPVDPEVAAERAVTGAALGATLGAGLGATAAINPLLGASIGAYSGAAIGGAIGIITSPPSPTYQPIAVPAQTVIPGFYDDWPPGYLPPPLNPETVPAHSG